MKFNNFYFINKNAFNYLDGVFVIFDYKNKLVTKLIKSFKYRFIKNLGYIIGEAMCNFLIEKEVDMKNSLIIPSPLHPKRENWRGFNQAEIIADKISSNFKIPLSKELIKTKHNKAQAELHKNKRKENVKNCFSWVGEKINYEKIFITDDLCTSGSTLDECAKELKNNGANKVYGLVIARG